MQNNTRSCTSVFRDKRGFSNIMWCILIVCLAIIMAFVLSYTLAVNIANSQKEVAEQVLNTYIDQNAIRIYKEVKQGDDYTDEVFTEEYVAMLVETSGLTDFGDGVYASMIDDTNYRYTVKKINLDFEEENSNTAKVVLTYTLTVPLEFNGDDPIWVDVPLKVTSHFEAHFGSEDIVGDIELPGGSHSTGIPLLAEYVIDFGLPVTLDLTEELPNGYTLKSVETPKYGSATVVGVNSIRYAPETVLLGSDYLKLTLVDKNERTYAYGIYIHPASTVYYEEGFINWGDGWTGGSKGNNNQTASQLGSSGNYGYDDAYASDTGASNGSQASSSTVGAKGTFTFTGTGFDLYANCDTDTGTVIVRINNADGKGVKLYMVDTHTESGKYSATQEQEGKFYNIPIVMLHDLPHGEYTVFVSKVTNDGKSVNIDGVRIYGTVQDSSIYRNDKESNPVFYEMRDQVLNAIGIADIMNGDTIDSIVDQVYDKNASASAMILDPSFDFSDEETAKDFLLNGPKNEIYLKPDATLAFKVSTKGLLQLGMKAPKSATTVEITVNGKMLDLTDISSSVDMFYSLGNRTGTKTDYLVTVKNTGSSLLSITQLKISGRVAAHNTTMSKFTKDDIEDALVASGSIQKVKLAEDMLLIDVDSGMIYLGSEDAWSLYFPDEPLDPEFADEYVTIGLPENYIVGDGAVVLYGDYLYSYNHVTDFDGDIDYTTEEFHTAIGSTMTLKDGWNVVVIDREKETYGKIASTVLGKPVTSMFYTFTNCQLMTEIPTVPKTVSAMAATYAWCFSLTEIKIPEHVTSIGVSVFLGCWRVSNVTIPDHIENIEASAFLGCYSLKNITIPKNVTYIGVSAFEEDALSAVFEEPNGWYVVKDGERIELDPADLSDPKNAGTLLDCKSEGDYVSVPGYCDYEWHRSN